MEYDPETVGLPGAPDIELRALPASCNFSDMSFANGLDSSAALNTSSLSGGGSFALSDADMLRCLSAMDVQRAVNQATVSVLKKPAVTACVIIVYVIVITIGGLGNLLVVITIATTKRMQNATNIFIANLAVADIFVCMFDLPLNLYYTLTGDWVYGRALCHVIPAIFGVIIYASTLSLTMIAVDRYLLIVTPSRRHMSVNIALVVAGVIGVLSVVAALPVAVYSDYYEVVVRELNIKFRICTEKWTLKGSRRIYTLMTLTIQFCVPLFLIAVLYALIFWKVRKVRKCIADPSKKRKKSKTNVMLVAVVMVFAICWIPYQIVSVVVEFQSSLLKGPYFQLVDVMLRVFAMSSSCVNPILYGWFNDNFRDAFLSIVLAKKKNSAATNSRYVTQVTARGDQTQLDAAGQSELMLMPLQQQEAEGSCKSRSLVEVSLLDQRKYGSTETADVHE